MNRFCINEETGEYEITPVFVRTAFNYDMDGASEESGLKCEDESKAQQQFKDECDINTIIERFGLSGELPQNLRVPLVGEFAEVGDYQQALNKLIEADDAFMQMPANIRARFGNDAGAFVDFVSDERNVEQAREWGLTRPQEAARAPIEVRVMAEPVPTAVAGQKTP